jgi:serine/threonine protein kinase
LGPGHYHLWKLGIHHRDISTGNLMYRKDENGHAHGTLSDFDLSSVCGEPSNNKQRTGTLPFMAIELLSASVPIFHKYEHDVESFYWVLLCAVLCAEDGRADCPMVIWGNLGMEALSEEKNHYINTSHFHDEFQPAETRQIDFHRFRFLGVRLAIRREIRVRKQLETWNSEPNQQPETSLDVDELFNTLEDGRRQGVKVYPLGKDRPECSGRSSLGHNSSMV